jgi:hypothetical protein
MRYKNVGILGTGSYLPLETITNHDIEKKIKTTHEWIKSKLGIEERRVAVEELPSDRGYYAAVNALESANLTINDKDTHSKTAYIYAKDNYNYKIIQILLNQISFKHNLNLPDYLRLYLFTFLGHLQQPPIIIQYAILKVLI